MDAAPFGGSSGSTQSPAMGTPQLGHPKKNKRAPHPKIGHPEATWAPQIGHPAAVGYPEPGTPQPRSHPQLGTLGPPRAVPGLLRGGDGSTQLRPDLQCRWAPRWALGGAPSFLGVPLAAGCVAEWQVLETGRNAFIWAFHTRTPVQRGRAASLAGGRHEDTGVRGAPPPPAPLLPPGVTLLIGDGDGAGVSGGVGVWGCLAPRWGHLCVGAWYPETPWDTASGLPWGEPKMGTVGHPGALWAPKPGTPEPSGHPNRAPWSTQTGHRPGGPPEPSGHRIGAPWGTHTGHLGGTPNR